jgi:hypothetical protein
VPDRGPGRISFRLHDVVYELSRDQVDSRLDGVAPETISKHAVRVNGAWFPVVQAFEVASGVPRRHYVSSTARRHLAALGYELVSRASSPDESP